MLLINFEIIIKLQFYALLQNKYNIKEFFYINLCSYTIIKIFFLMLYLFYKSAQF